MTYLGASNKSNRLVADDQWTRTPTVVGSTRDLARRVIHDISGLIEAEKLVETGPRVTPKKRPFVVGRPGTSRDANKPCNRRIAAAHRELPGRSGTS